jgi:DNA polymerase III subunit epsilon
LPGDSTVIMPHRQLASDWARRVLSRDDVIFLDTETTGLDARAEIVDIALIDRDGRVLLDQLVRPRRPIPPGATRVHGIDDALVRDAPAWPEVYPLVAEILRRYRCVVIYNAEFDRNMLSQVCRQDRLDALRADWHCAMQRYAEYVGQRHERYGGYRWHKLDVALAAFDEPVPPNAHRALADAESCRRVVYAMSRLHAPGSSRRAY